ncbi:MAG: hypothetical protein HUU22_03805 [Phycisphaerae bacterium]|nr:hypothetical protein [Phycisphaerae bacterium]NUQ45141.1 hypothetical protein [Phycisphaerae bacterium]
MSRSTGTDLPNRRFKLRFSSSLTAQARQWTLAIILTSSLLLIVSGALMAGPGSPPTPLPTNAGTFYLRGTQPNTLTEPILHSLECTGCHGDPEPPPTAGVPIYEDWSGSLKAQAARDPLFYACLDIAERDAPGIGETCIRCHVPMAWLDGRSQPSDGSAITSFDRDGINCNFCHRNVDPFQYAGAPPVDAAIIAALGADAPVQSMDLGNPSMPGDGGNASYVIDPLDQRRGPFPVTPPGSTPVPPEANCDFFHRLFTNNRDTFQSPFHLRADFCATCHDVSPPHFRLDNGVLVFNGGNPHPTGNKYEMVPEQRTYSEWLKSDFVNGVDMGGRFGGEGQTVVSTCQDCHMPMDFRQGCAFEPARPDLPRHFFSGAGNWVLDAIGLQYGPGDGGPPQWELDQAQVDMLQANKLRNLSMLARAATLTASLDDGQTPGQLQLRVRVVNETGHKLPTGYPEGRRMWLTVDFYDCVDYVNPMFTYGAYDFGTATLDEVSTKVYEAKFGADAALAALTGLPEGPHFHVALANAIYKDNRIPPRGFNNTNFAAINAAPVGASYADGQYWDDTWFAIPGYAVGARVRLYYQTSSREYVEFLRDNNNPATNRGQMAYDLWLQTGMGAPVLMAELGDAQPVDVSLKGDVNGDRRVDGEDIRRFLDVLYGLETDARCICAADMDSSTAVDPVDVPLFVEALLGL